jgi:uncharacterized membrane protein
MSAPTIPPTALVLAASVLGAVGQVVLRSGAMRLDGGALAFLTEPRVIAVMGCSFAVMVLQALAFRQGGSVASLYPLHACSYLWAALLAWALHGDVLRPVNVLGAALLVAGVGLLKA